MLETWIDDKKVDASSVRIVYTNKGGERSEIKVSADGDDAWMSLRQVDSAGHTMTEMESWNDNNRLLRNVTISTDRHPPKQL